MNHTNTSTNASDSARRSRLIDSRLIVRSVTSNCLLFAAEKAVMCVMFGLTYQCLCYWTHFYAFCRDLERSRSRTREAFVIEASLVAGRVLLVALAPSSAMMHRSPPNRNQILYYENLQNESLCCSRRRYFFGSWLALIRKRLHGGEATRKHIDRCFCTNKIPKKVLDSKLK